jgi:hypothetical protein
MGTSYDVSQGRDPIDHLEKSDLFRGEVLLEDLLSGEGEPRDIVQTTQQAAIIHHEAISQDTDAPGDGGILREPGSSLIQEVQGVFQPALADELLHLRPQHGACIGLAFSLLACLPEVHDLGELGRRGWRQLHPGCGQEVSGLGVLWLDLEHLCPEAKRGVGFVVPVGLEACLQEHLDVVG